MNKTGHSSYWEVCYFVTKVRNSVFCNVVCLYSEDLCLIEACVNLVILNFTVDFLVHDRNLERENAIC